MPIVVPVPSTPLPIPPSTTDIVNFDARGDTFNLALQEDFQPDMDALAQSAYQNALYSHERAQTASAHADDAADKRDQAETYRNQAATAAATAVNAPGTSSTSATGLTVGTGAQAFVTQGGKAWAVGQPVMIARTSAPASTYMIGTVTAYNSGTGAMSVMVASGATAGAGTFADWTISLTGPRGAAGSKPTMPIAVNTVAVSGNHYVLTASLVLTLPAAPPVDAVVQFSNLSGTLTATVNPGAELINGTSGAMLLDSLHAAAELKYSGATKGWIF